MIRKFRDIFKNPFVQRIFKNMGVLLGGDTCASLIGMATFIITARSLGVAQLGALALIDAYVRVVDKLINFQSWQFMIKFGADALSHKRPDQFRALVKIGTIIDAGTALLGFISAALLAQWCGQWQGWPREMIVGAQIYSLMILFNFAGVPTGILRLFNQFKLFTMQNIVSALIKFMGVAVAAFFNAGLKGFLLAWLITEIAGYLFLTYLGWRELKRQGLGSVWRVSLRSLSKDFPGFWSFLFSTNLTGSIKTGFREVDILIVGKMLGLTDVSFYKLAKKMASFLARLTNPLYNALYPELAKLWAAKDGNNFRKVTRHTILVMFLMGAATLIFFFLTGRSIIEWGVGKDYLAAYPISLWHMVANVVAVSTAPFAPMLLAMGKAKTSLFVQLLPTLLYFPIAVVLIGQFGLTGAGMAFLTYFVMRAGLQFWKLSKYLSSGLGR